jgi:hypothetical protein
MFYGQCWKCGERWELGTASTCKCPDIEPVKFAFKENNDSAEVLRVTPKGEFIWHPDADKLLAEGDFSQSPALPHILKALRKQRTWVGLTLEEILETYRGPDGSDYVDYARGIEAKLKERNT